MLSGDSQCAETRELEHLITESLPNNTLLQDASLTALFQLSGLMSHVTLCSYSIVRAVFSGCTTLQELGGYIRVDTNTETARQQDGQSGDNLRLLSGEVVAPHIRPMCFKYPRRFI